MIPVPQLPLAKVDADATPQALRDIQRKLNDLIQASDLVPSGRSGSLTPRVFVEQNAKFNVRDYYKADDGADIAVAGRRATAAADLAGGGSVWFPAQGDPYICSSVVGAHSVFMQPRSNITYEGDGPDSVLKAADGLFALAGDGYAFFSHFVSDEGIAQIDNFTVRNLKFDHNGANNLIPAGGPFKSGRAVHIEVGSNIRVEDCTFSNNAGTQTVALGNNTSPQKIAKAYVLDCTFEESGKSVTGNVNSKDHSSVYIQARAGVVRGCTFTNANAPAKNTAIECHSSTSVVEGNTVTNYAVMFNVVATVTDHVGTVYRGNVATGLQQFIVLWVYGGFVMDDVLFQGNVVRQYANLATVGSFIDLESHVNVAAGTLSFDNNKLRSLAAAGQGFGDSCFTLGRFASMELTRNRMVGFTGRAVELGNVNAGCDLTLDDNHITDCGTTTAASYRKGIDLNTSTSLRRLLVRRNSVANVSGTYMTQAIGGNVPVSGRAYVEDNVVENVATEVNFTTPANFRFRNEV